MSWSRLAPCDVQHQALSKVCPQKPGDCPCFVGDGVYRAAMNNETYSWLSLRFGIKFVHVWPPLLFLWFTGVLKINAIYDLIVALYQIRYTLMWYGIPCVVQYFHLLCRLKRTYAVQMHVDLCWFIIPWSPLMWPKDYLNMCHVFYYNFSVNFLQSTWIRPQNISQTKILEVTSLVNHHL